MNRKLVIIAPLAILLALAGCTGAVAPDDVSTDAPTVSPEAPDATSVVGTTWGEKPFLLFDDDGTFSGDAGCNSISGDWEQDGDTVTFGPAIAMTQMGCSGTPDWVDFPATATVTDASLTLFSADGAVIDKLLRQD